MINPPELFDPPGFSHVVVASGGRIVSIAGQVALDRDFSIIGGDDLAAQTRAAMKQVKVALEAADATWENVIRRTIYTLFPTQFEAIGKAIAEVTARASRRRRPSSA